MVIETLREQWARVAELDKDCRRCIETLREQWARVAELEVGVSTAALNVPTRRRKNVLRAGW